MAPPHRRRITAAVLFALVATAVLTLGVPAPARADADPAPTSLVLDGPAEAYAGTRPTLSATLTDAAAAPLAAVPVVLERQLADGSWTPAGSSTTGAAGHSSFQPAVPLGTTTFRARFDGSLGLAASSSPPLTVAGMRAPTSFTLGGPTSVVDEQAVTLTVRWSTVDGRPVSGAATLQLRRRGTTTWRSVSRLAVREGVATSSQRPRTDVHWRVVGAAGPTHLASTSEPRFIDNLPPGVVVRLPSAAPEPRALPAQRRAVGAGVNPGVRRIPAKVWRSMTGRSWHRGCPVGRGGLRLVRVNYWGFDGYRHRGELVVNQAIAGKTVRAFRLLYRARIPVRAMYRVDRFGWSSRLRGANDYASMAADNTSAFNCRRVVGRPGVRSPHSWGRSIDLNPWENPYAGGSEGWLPNRWWVGRTHPLVAWRSSGHRVVKLMRKAGFRWSYGVRDAHHFDG